jgi:uncharacterized membrane protein
MDMEVFWTIIGYLVSIAICAVPVILVLGVVIFLVVTLARRKPKATSQRKPAAKPKAAAGVEAAPQPKAVAVEEIATKSCSSCGADNPADNAFCEYCGASMADE